MRIVTWNVNSIRARLERVLGWLERTRPDIALLQEIKTVESGFPQLELSGLGYGVALIGEPTYNGVAILARTPIEDVVTVLPGDPSDWEARWIEATVGGLRVASVYVPNGTAVGSDRFRFKLAFFERLRAHAAALLESGRPFLIGGDFNVGPYPIDVFDPEGLEGTICYHADERRGWRAMRNLGLYDAWRCLHPDAPGYSWWPYQGRALAGDQGLRIDHLLLSPALADRLQAVGIDRGEREAKGASDHAPVWCELEVEAQPA